MLRRIPLEHLDNLRDLGGWACGKDYMTCWGKFYRSDVPADLTGQEKQWLLNHAITTIIDLRNADEIGRRPNCLAEEPGFFYHNHSIYEPDRVEPVKPSEGKPLVGEFYLRMLDSTDAPQKVMRTVLNAPGGVLFHCSAGKDRTGLVAALLMLLAGVSPLDVVADYQVSYTYIEAYALAMLAQNPDRSAYAYYSDPDYMKLFLEEFGKKYGTAEGWMRQKGFSEEEIETLKKKLREPM